MHTLCFDFESYRFVPGAQIPPAVCMSYAFVTPQLTLGDRGVILWQQGIKLLRRALNERWLLVGAQTAFDLLVSVYNDAQPEALMRQWVNAVESGLVLDVLIRQPLLDAANDQWRGKYSLDTVGQLHGHPALNKKNPWRLKFGELDGVPIANYPPEAYNYALEDAVATAVAFIGQERQRQNGSPYFPGYDQLLNQGFQQAGAITLVDIESYGLRANPRSVRNFKTEKTARMLELRATLEAEGLITREYKRNMANVARYAQALGQPIPLTPRGAVSSARKYLQGDDLLRACIDWRANAERLVRAGLVDCKFKAPDEPARARIKAGFECQGLPVPMTTPRKQKRGESRAEYEQYVAGFTPNVKVDNDACTRCGDPVMKLYAEYDSLVNLLGSAMSILEEAAVVPFHAHYTPILATGRTASGGEEKKGNVQNPRRTPGVRECTEARGREVEFNGVTIHLPESRVLIEADYESGELYTFAQICKWVGGWSEVGRKLMNGLDMHTELAADIRGIMYKEAKALGKDALGDDRTAGKAINYLRKGGGGAGAFERAAWNQYEVDVNKIPGGAKRLMDLHDARTPEFHGIYSPWVKSHARSPGRNTKYDIVLPWSGMLSAGRFFTDAHNYPFQHLLSCIAKRALWLIFKARWGLSELGRNDPLYNCGVVLFGHDSITAEVLESRALVAAKRFGELMCRASREISPDYPTPAEPCAQRQLSKKAKPVVVKDENDPNYGELCGIWDAWQACRDTATKLIDSGKVDSLVCLDRELRKDDWPGFIVRDIAAEHDGKLPPF